MVFDPLSVAGVALGGISLAFQVFDSSIECFKFIVDASRMEESCAERRLSLIIEFHRLMEWGKKAGLVEQETGDSIAVSLQASPVEMSAIVSEINTLLRKFSHLNERYETLIDPDDPAAAAKAEKDAAARNLVEEIDNMVLRHEKTKTKREHTRGTNHIRAAGKHTVDFVKHPKRIIWSKIDKGAFDELLVRLRELSNRLIEMMGNHQTREIELNVKKSYLNIVQLLDNSRDLNRLMTATLLFTARRPNNPSDLRDSNDAMLEELARLKTLNEPYNPKGQIGTGPARAVALDRVIVTPDEAKQKRSMAFLKSDSSATATTQSVWIEWKPYEKEYTDDSGVQKIHPGTLRRTSELSVLLSHPKPAGFATPKCLGYFDESEKTTVPFWEGRFGWIFEIPSSVARTTTPRSLLYLMSAVQCPSLTDRVALASRVAECVLFLHATNWLHKALRSDNIIFFYNGETPAWSNAIVSGFEYSRPDNLSTTDNPKFSPELDLYRWPSVQNMAATEKRSRKTYDIYSLGLLLVEIAYWKSLEKILSFGDIKNVTSEQTQSVRSTLLDAKLGYLEEIKRRMGVRFASVVETCLKGHESFNIAEKAKQNEPEVGLKIQQLYTEAVVDKLAGIRI